MILIWGKTGARTLHYHFNFSVNLNLFQNKSIFLKKNTGSITGGKITANLFMHLIIYFVFLWHYLMKPSLASDLLCSQERPSNLDFFSASTSPLLGSEMYTPSPCFGGTGDGSRVSCWVSILPAELHLQLIQYLFLVLLPSASSIVDNE